jgi:hypothetical protein
MWKALVRAAERVPRCRAQRLMAGGGIQGAKRRGKPVRRGRLNRRVRPHDSNVKEFPCRWPRHYSRAPSLTAPRSATRGEAGARGARGGRARGARQGAEGARRRSRATDRPGEAGAERSARAETRLPGRSAVGSHRSVGGLAPRLSRLRQPCGRHSLAFSDHPNARPMGSRLPPSEAHNRRTALGQSHLGRIRQRDARFARDESDSDARDRHDDHGAELQPSARPNSGISPARTAVAPPEGNADFCPSARADRGAGPVRY